MADYSTGVLTVLVEHTFSEAVEGTLICYRIINGHGTTPKSTIVITFCIIESRVWSSVSLCKLLENFT